MYFLVSWSKSRFPEINSGNWAGIIDGITNLFAIYTQN